MSLNPVLDLIANPQFAAAGDFSEFTLIGVFPGPSLASYWTSSTLKPANGSGGNIPFPTVGGYTPTAYTAPATNAPAGNAAFVGWGVASLCGFVYSLPPLSEGTTYTFTFSYAGNPSATNLSWFLLAYVSMPDGTVGTFSPAEGSPQPQPFSPAGGWQTYSITFTADQSASSAQAVIFGGGTDGTIAFGASNTITGASVMSPLLVGGLHFTYQSQGARAYPPSALPVGTTLGSVMSGGDARIPRLDSAYFVRPRTERVEFEFASPEAAMAAPAKPVFPGVRGCYITSITYTLDTFLSGSPVLAIDFTVNTVSIYAVTSVSELPTLGNGFNPTLAGYAYFSQPNYFISSIPGAAAMLGMTFPQVSGQPTNFLASVELYYP